RMEGMRKTLKSLRSRTTSPLIHLESPPPIPSEKHIRAYPSFYEAKIGQRGVAPAVLRYKLWRLHSSLVQEYCRALDITFLPVPPEVQDEERMLCERAWTDDPTHGNAYYGRCVFRQLARISTEMQQSRR